MLIIFFAALLSAAVSAKTTYSDGNYSEEGGTRRMCMRCHMGLLSPSGVGLNLSSALTSVAAGSQINVTATKSNFKPQWKPGIALHFEFNSQYASRPPQELGWQVVASPHAGPDNFVRLLTSENGSSSFTWILKAPQRPGPYRIATSAYFNDSSLANANPGTERGDNSLLITVGRATESVKPTVLSVVSFYKMYVFVKFSEPVDTVEALNPANYEITHIQTSQKLSISGVYLYRDGSAALLKTAAHSGGGAYSTRVQNLKDYATAPNVINPVTVQYTPDLKTSYRIYAEFTQDVTASDIGQFDETEYLGRNLTNGVNRMNLLFSIPDRPIDMLTGIPFVKAVLRVQQKNSPRQSAAAQSWDAYTLTPNNNWYDYFGNNLTVQENFSGYNQGSTPVASLSKNVVRVDSGVPEIWWEWDITSSFRPRYQSPGQGNCGSLCTNRGEYYLRLRARDEAANAGAGFFGHDAPLLSQVPYIELVMDSAGTGAEGLAFIGTSDKLHISPNPIAATGRIILPESWGGGTKEVFIHDLSGKQVDRVVAPGFWDVRGMPSGVYIATARGAGGVVRQKITVLR